MAKSSRYQGITVDITFQGNTTKFNEAVTQIDKSLKNIDSELNKVNKDLRLDPANTTLASQKFELLGEKIRGVKEKLSLMRQAQKEIEQAYSRGEIDKGTYRDFQRELAATEGQLKNLQNEVKKTASVLTADLKKAVADLKTEFSGAADIIKKAELALVAFSAASVKTGSDFESSMSQVAATMGIDKVTEDYEKLTAAAKEMGSTTSYTSSDAASALNSLAQAGYSADEAIERLPKTLALAKAGGLDLASSAKIVTNSMAALNLSEEELNKLLDEMARTGQKSNTNIRELGEAVKTVGGTMEMADQSIETMFTELGMLANAGVTASEAGTHLRNILLALAKTDVQSSLHDMGVEVVDSTGKIRDLCDIMTDLKNATSDMQSGELLATFGDLFNVRDLASINALLNGTTGSMQALRAEIENSEGAATAMADTMSDNLTGDINILRSAVQDLQISVSDKLTPSLRTAAKDATGLMNTLSESAKTGELADSFERFGESFARMTKSGTSLAADLLPKIIDGLTWIADHADDILVVYIGIKTEAKAKVLFTAVKDLTSGVIGLKAAITGATAAQEGFNAAAGASPLTAVITAGAVAVGGLAALFTKLSLELDITNEKLDYMSDEVREITEAAQAEITASSELISKNKELVDTLTSEKQHYSDVADKLYRLADAEDLSTAEKEKMIAYVDELNKTIPTLNLSIDSTTGKLNKEKGAVENLIQAYKDYEAKRQYIASLTELETNQDQLRNQYDALSAQVEQKKKVLDAARNSISVLKNPYEVSTTYEEYQAWQEADKILKQATDDYVALAVEWTSLGTQIRDNADQIDYFNGKIEEITNEPLVAVADAAQSMTNSLQESTKATDKQTNAAEKNTKAEKDLTKQTSNYRSELTNLLGVLDNVNKGTAYSTSQILDLIGKYPELASAIQLTADGYRIEAAAVENLTKVKAQELLVSMQAQIAEAKAEARVKETMARIGAGITGDTSTLERIQAEIRGLDDTLAGYERLVNDISSGKIYNGSSSSTSSYSSGSSSGGSAAEDKTDYYKQQAEQEIAALEHEYKMGRMLAEEYYNKLDELNKKWYLNKYEYLDDYRKYEEKIYAGLEKIQEERISAAKTLEDRLIAAKKAQDDLTNAQNQKSNVYGGAAGWHAEINSAAVSKAQQTLFEKEQSLSEILAKVATLGGLNSAAISANVLPNLRALLPDLTGLKLPATQTSGGTVTNNAEKSVNITYSPNITIQGNATAEDVQRLKDTLELQFNELINTYITKEYNEGVIS